MRCRRDEEVNTDTAMLVAMAQPMPDIISLLKEETTSRSDLCELRRKIEAGEADPMYYFCDGLIYWGRRIFVSAEFPLREALLYEHHSTPQAGHSGFERTLRCLVMQFHWPHMRRDVKIFVAACVVCQTTKYST